MKKLLVMIFLISSLVMHASSALTPEEVNNAWDEMGECEMNAWSCIENCYSGTESCFEEAIKPCQQRVESCYETCSTSLQSGVEGCISSCDNSLQNCQGQCGEINPEIDVACQDNCVNQVTRCYDNCEGDESCTIDCDDLAQDCFSNCGVDTSEMDLCYDNCMSSFDNCASNCEVQIPEEGDDPCPECQAIIDECISEAESECGVDESCVDNCAFTATSCVRAVSYPSSDCHAECIRTQFNCFNACGEDEVCSMKCSMNVMNCRNNCEKKCGEECRVRHEHQNHEPPEEAFGYDDIPMKCPSEVQEAGACQEFIDLMCAEARLNVGMFVEISSEIKTIFQNLIANLSEVGVDLSINFTNLNNLISNIDSKIEGVCSSNPDNFGDSMTELMDVLTGDEGVERIMNGIGEQIGSQMESQFNNMQSNIESEMMDYMNEVMSQAQSGQITPEEAQQLIESYAEQMTQKAEGLQSYIENLFSNLENRMESLMSEIDTAHANSEVADAHYELFMKVFNHHIGGIVDRRDELEEAGFNVTLMDEFISWISRKRIEAREVFSANSTQEDREAFIEKVTTDGERYRERIQEDIDRQVSDGFLNEAKNLMEIIENGIAKAQNAGLDTSNLESLLSEFMQLVNNAESAANNQSYSLAIRYMSQARDKFGEIKTEWDRLNQELISGGA